MRSANYQPPGSVRQGIDYSDLPRPELTRDKEGRITSVSFLIPPPKSKKNNKALIVINGRTRVGTAKCIKDQEAAIRMHVARAVPLLEAGPLFGDVHDVGLELVHLIEKDLVQVTVYRLGDAVEVAGRTGRRRDVPNLFESVCDALEGLLYENDRQIACVKAERRAR